MIRCLRNHSIKDLEQEAGRLQEVQKGHLSEMEARRQVANTYGFLSWRQLEVYVLATGSNSPSNGPVDITQIACLNYFRRSDTNLDLAKRMAIEDPMLSQRDLYHASCLGDVEAVKTLLKKQPELINARGGYFAWEPLLYACYSRVHLPGKSTMEAARELLKHGADPNAHFMWGGQYKFTALCGVFAEGEDGPSNFPEHIQCESFARLLLEAGADPNDGQALYNRMFTPSSLCLQLLLEYGLKPDALCNWLLNEGDTLVPSHESTLHYQLKYAVKSGHSDRAKLLVQQGTSLATSSGEPSLYEMALLAGDAALADYLVNHGAEHPPLPPTTAFAAACLCGDEPTARAMLAEDPGLMTKARHYHPHLLDRPAETGRPEIMRLLVALGADLNFPRSPLFTAVWHGDLAMIKLLVDLGADTNVRDPAHHATPLQWAQYHGNREEIIDYLSSISSSSSPSE